MTYKLCYVDGNHAYFTSNWKKQWGDDWNDRPYEHNAEPPYHDYFNENGVEIPISIKDCFFDVPTQVSTPCDGYDNSPYSVEDINNNVVPWLRLGYGNDRTYVFAKTSYSKFVKIIEEFGGTIYEPKRKRSTMED